MRTPKTPGELAFYHFVFNMKSNPLDEGDWDIFDNYQRAAWEASAAVLQKEHPVAAMVSEAMAIHGTGSVAQGLGVTVDELSEAMRPFQYAEIDL